MPKQQKSAQLSQQGRPARRQALPRPQKIPNKFVHQCTPPPVRLASDKSKRLLKRQFDQLPLTGTPSFTPDDTKEAIRLAKSSSNIGPDEMSTLHLKKLALGAINNLTNIVNLNYADIRNMALAIIIPIGKPGMYDIIGKNWRPTVYCALRPKRWKCFCCPQC